MIVVVSSLFFSLSFAKRIFFEIEKNVAFFYPQSSGIKNTASSFFARRRLVYSFEAIFSLSLSFTLLFSRVCLKFERLFLRAALGEREREREREGKRERLLVSFYLVS